MKTGNREILSLDAWNVLLLRITVFPHPMTVYKSDTWWSEITEKTADEITQNPKVMMRSEGGSYGSGKLILSTVPNRIDWVYKIKEDNLIEVDFQGGTLGKYIPSREMFFSLITKWLKFRNLSGV